MNLFRALIMSLVVIYSLTGCSLMNKVGHKLVDATEDRVQRAKQRREMARSSQEDNQPENKQNESQTSSGDRKERKKKTSAKDNENFITAPNLSAKEFEELWIYTIDTCYDRGYSVTFQDRATKNLACQYQGETGTTFTVRVRFSQKGILVDTKSNNLLATMFAVKKMTANMKETLEDKVRELRGDNFAEIGRSPDNEKILKAQRELVALQYDPGAPDGVMGEKTKNAIVDFQKDHNLDPTGMLDEKTLSALDKSSETVDNIDQMRVQEEQHSPSPVQAVSPPPREKEKTMDQVQENELSTPPPEYDYLTAPPPGEES